MVIEAEIRNFFSWIREEIEELLRIEFWKEICLFEDFLFRKIFDKIFVFTLTSDIVSYNKVVLFFAIIPFSVMNIIYIYLFFK
jgi:hypothetical protein